MTAEKNLAPVGWSENRLVLVDQTAIPARYETIAYDDWRDVVTAIKTMVVRGAPAIGCTAAYGMALAARNISADSPGELLSQLRSAGDAFRASRPTAVNLFWAVDRMLECAAANGGSADDLRARLLQEAHSVLEEDIAANRRMGRYGAELLPDEGVVLTHCNAGALATGGYGTALGVIRAAREAGKNIAVLADETRPRLQGMKLTAWELAFDGIPVTVVADNMAASLMRAGKIDCVVLGADRIASNGDTANKIGTYGVAVLARYHGIPFYVAAPLSTIDPLLASGDEIPIEYRPDVEMTHIDGVRIAPEGVPVLNPAFDVTPYALVTAFITECGVLQPPFTLDRIAQLSRTSSAAAL